MIYPKDRQENIRFRAQLLDMCAKDKDARGYVWEMIKRDPLFTFNVLFYTYDPRTKVKDEPFITFPFQDETILKINSWIENGENGFIDKSRDMGATYMVLYVFLWRWLTKKGEKFRLGSRTEDYVDKSGDLSTLFEKLRYCLDRIPGWFLPAGYDRKKHSTYMRLLNPELGCAIIGEATNANFARGGRENAVLFDEFQAWEMADEAWRSASDSTKCKISLGTPDGAGNKFAELSRTEEVKNKVRLHWSLHPHKAVTNESHLEKQKNLGLVDINSNAPAGCYIDINGKIRSEWYDSESSTRDKEDVAANLDIDYLQTGRPVFDTQICDRRLRECIPPIAVGDLRWQTRPLFSNDGQCINSDQLEVEFIPNINGLVKIWEYPEKDYDNGYCGSADCAEGLEQGDYNSASILKRYGGEKDRLHIVATIHGHLKDFEYADELAKLGTYYGKCYIAIEREGNAGGSVIAHIRKVYPYLFHKEVMTKGFPQMTDRIGWFTNHMTKPVIIGNLSKLITNNTFLDLDEGFWRETLTFVNNDGTLEAQGKSKGQKCYDDRVMDRAILLHINNELPLPSRKRQMYKPTGWRAVEQKSESLLRF